MNLSYMVLLNPLNHDEHPLALPAGVGGGVMGDTDKGLMAVYDVPKQAAPAFEQAVQSCAAVLRWERLAV